MLFHAQHGVIASQSGLNPRSVAEDARIILSLYKWVESYSGDSIRVRRDSDNAEQDIGFAGSVLDTSAIETFGGGANVHVVTWYDQSGNGEDHTQSSASAQGTVAFGDGYNSVVKTSSDGGPMVVFTGSYYTNGVGTSNYMSKNGTVVLHQEEDSSVSFGVPYSELKSLLLVFAATSNSSTSHYGAQHDNAGSPVTPSIERDVALNVIGSYIYEVDAGGNASGSASATLRGYENNKNSFTPTSIDSRFSGDIATTILGSIGSGVNAFSGEIRTAMVFTKVFTNSERAALKTMKLT